MTKTTPSRLESILMVICILLFGNMLFSMVTAVWLMRFAQHYGVPS